MTHFHLNLYTYCNNTKWIANHLLSNPIKIFLFELVHEVLAILLVVSEGVLMRIRLQSSCARLNLIHGTSPSTGNSENDQFGYVFTYAKYIWGWSLYNLLYEYNYTLPQMYRCIPRYQGLCGQHWVNLGPVGPRWDPYWPHRPCYQGWPTSFQTK